MNVIRVTKSHTQRRGFRADLLICLPSSPLWLLAVAVLGGMNELLAGVEELRLFKAGRIACLMELLLGGFLLLSFSLTGVLAAGAGPDMTPPVY